MDVDKVASLFKVLGTPSRLHILLALLEDDRCASDLSACVGKDVSTAWRHVRALEDTGVVEVRKEGRKIVARVRDKETVRMLLNAAGRLIN